MCSYSMVSDFYLDKWRERPWYPYVPTYPISPSPSISKREFDELVREVRDMKELLRRAKDYDDKTGQPDCELAEKFNLLASVARIVDVDLTKP